MTDFWQHEHRKSRAARMNGACMVCKKKTFVHNDTTKLVTIGYTKQFCLMKGHKMGCLNLMRCLKLPVHSPQLSPAHRKKIRNMEKNVKNIQRGRVVELVRARGWCWSHPFSSGPGIFHIDRKIVLRIFFILSITCFF